MLRSLAAILLMLTGAIVGAYSLFTWRRNGSDRRRHLALASVLFVLAGFLLNV